MKPVPFLDLEQSNIFRYVPGRTIFNKHISYSDSDVIWYRVAVFINDKWLTVKRTMQEHFHETY